MIRLIVCMDFDTDNLEEAYRKLRDCMARANPSDGWETSEEWYDGDGETGSEEELHSVILKVLGEELPTEYL